jgi:hypothetical protein
MNLENRMRSKIFGIGLSRTGTTTLNEVLVGLGYKVIHYPTEAELFDMRFDGATDIPVTVRYKELDQKFPNSKFIYTIRDKEKWLDSIVPYLERKRGWNMAQAQVDIRTQMYGSPFPNRAQAESAYNSHDRDVMEYFKKRKNDLLVLDIIGGDSTKLLTDFLGVDPIDPEFPHKNKLKK